MEIEHDEWQDFDESFLKEVDTQLQAHLKRLGIIIPKNLNRNELYNFYDGAISEKISGVDVGDNAHDS